MICSSTSSHLVTSLYTDWLIHVMFMENTKKILSSSKLFIGITALLYLCCIVALIIIQFGIPIRCQLTVSYIFISENRYNFKDLSLILDIKVQFDFNTDSVFAYFFMVYNINSKCIRCLHTSQTNLALAPLNNVIVNDDDNCCCCC